MRITVAAALLLLAASAAAQEAISPRLTALEVQWDPVAAALNDVDALKQSAPAKTTPEKFELLARLNLATAQRLPEISASPVPVLLPLDRDAYLRDRAEGHLKADSEGDYFFGFGAPKFFLPGPGGYDAAFTLRPQTVATLSGLTFAGEAEVQISGLNLLYELGAAVGIEPKQIKDWQSEFPGVRSIYLESHMRYLFTRYGVLYAVSLECFDGVARPKRLSCREADAIATQFLKALTVAGGMPHPPALPPEPQTVERPQTLSSAFAYHAPGQLISGTGARQRGGHVDYTVYEKIRFPLAEAPAHTYSQVFMSPGDCDPATANSTATRRRGAAFRCPPSNQVAEVGESSGANYAYPWRDNFCEARSFFVGQCPGGLGHQGEDIVPVDCRLSSQDAGQCDRKLHPVVAVHDGAVLRSPGQEGLVIVVNAQNRHLRFRYLHMNPTAIDEAGFLSGRRVSEGEVVGNVGNYNGREGGTSYHLHFDMQVPTADGWVLVNPYMTLVSAYENLVGARGKEIHDEEAKQAALAPADEAAPQSVMKPVSHANVRAAHPFKWKSRRFGGAKQRAAAHSKKKLAKLCKSRRC